MNKQPRLAPVFVALSVALASGPLPAAAQMRAQVGVGTVGSAPVGLPSGIVAPANGSFSNVSGLGLNGTIPAASVASSLELGMNAASGRAVQPAIAPKALTVVVPSAVKQDGEIYVKTPGAAATGVQAEVSAFEDVTPAMPALKKGAAVVVNEGKPAAKNEKGGIVSTVLSALGLTKPAASVNFDGSKDGKPAPIFAALSLKEQKPLSLPNGSSADEQPTTPSPDREPTTRVEVFAVPGSHPLGPVVEGRKVLEVDAANTTAIVEAVKAVVDADVARYGVSSADLRLIHAQRFEGRGEQADSVFVYFRQIKNGLIVNGSALSFTVKVLDGKPVIVAQTGQTFPQVDANTEATMSDEQVADAISRRTGMPAADVSSTFEFFEQKLVYTRGQWRNVKLYVAEGLPFMVAVDMNDGSVFAWDNRTGLESAANPSAAGVSGKVAGRTVDKGPILKDSEITEVPLPFLEVKIGGKSYVTDKEGKLPADLQAEIGPEGLELTATLSGPYVRVENQQGATLSVKVKVTAGDNKVVFNPSSNSVSDENTLAQINAFHKVNMSLNFLRERKLSNERMDKTQLPVRTNVDDECNAYYTPGRPSLNFFRSSRNCVNSAYDTVAEHENGHYWDDFTGGIVNGGLSEGWGDILSMFRLNNPVIGEHFLKQSRGGVDYIRHGENTYQYNEYDEVHDQGQAWGGFAWKLRKALIAKLGYEEGAAVAESLIMPTMFAKATTIPDAMAQVLINAHKRDGGILHEAEIRAAAKAHGITLPTGVTTPDNAPASWSKVSVKSSEITPVGEDEGGSRVEIASDDIRPTHEDASQAQGVLSFSLGRSVRADGLAYIRAYLDHFGVDYTLTRVTSGGNSSRYELTMKGSARAIENLTKRLKSGQANY